MGLLLKFLFIIIAIVWLVKQVVRLLLPILFEKIINKVQSQTGHRYEYRHRKSDNQVKVDYMPPKKKTNTAGDFVDFEEVK